MEQILHKVLRSPPPSITPEQYSEWKHHPVTLNLFTELLGSIFTQFDERLPNNLDQGTALAYKRDGACELLDILWSWEPQNMSDDDD